MSSVLPEWFEPNNGAPPALTLLNSLTRSKVEFKTESGTNQVGFYICGPTVYDSAHMGHARAYLTFDIMRRVLEDYFHYDVFWVMNITDIDDKIILKARRNHLFGEYEKGKPSRDTVHSDLATALAKYYEKNVKGIAEDTADPKEQMYLRTFKQVTDVLADSSKTAEELIKGGKDILSEHLDALHGAEVSEHSIFQAHAFQYEEEYLNDMKALGVKPADVLTRVSEYIPEVVDYVQKIIDNGLAYASNGSVYFDTNAFSQKQAYAKLKPEMVGDKKLAAEGEGALAAEGNEKRNERDFALWKASKAGEPRWESPWGAGRPGWHIECSAMASDMLGCPIDIHAGGIDLTFPHHDNEMAQAEAFFGHKQWVNYFLHAGHVHIEGHKMSKSFKNFITIGAALTHYSARQIRMMFLLHSWEGPMNYSEENMDAAIQKEKMFSEFFHSVKSLVRDQETKGTSHIQRWGDAERALHKMLREKQVEIDLALRDSIDYAKVMVLLTQITQAAGQYMEQAKKGEFAVQGYVPRQVAIYVTRILRIFGVVNDADGFGFPVGGSGDKETTLAPYLNLLAQFRDTVRGAARAGGDDMKKVLLKACDDIRDAELPQLGVRLEDAGEGGAGVWKLADPETLLLEMKQKQAAADEAARKKAEAKAKKEREDAEKLEKAKVDPLEMFKSLNLVNQVEYDVASINAETGLPTKLADGTELTKSGLKKVQKAQAAQKKAHEKYLKTLA